MKAMIYLGALIFLLVGMNLNLQGNRIQEARTLRVWVTAAEYDLLTDLNPAFEEQYGVQVKMSIVEGDQVLGRLPLYRRAAIGPDIINTPHTFITELVQDDLISSLTPYFEAFNILYSARKGLEVMGEYYGIPYQADTDLLFYDASQFPDGVEPYQLARESTLFSLALAYNDIYHTHPFITGFGGYTIGRDNFGNINFYDIGLNSDQTAQGLTQMALLLDPEIRGGTETDILQSFLTGRANVLIAPANKFELLNQKPDLGFQAIPDFTPNTISLTYSRMDTYQLTNRGQNKELALLYLKFLISDQVSAARFELNRTVAPLLYDSILSSDPFYLTVKKQLHRSEPLPNQLEFNYFFTPYNQAAEIFTRRISQLQQSLDDAVRQIGDKVTTR